MPILTFCGGERRLAIMFGAAIAGWVMTSILMATTIPIAVPLSQQGQGSVEITTNDSFPGYCASGFGYARTGNSCTLTASTPSTSPSPGNMSGSATAFTDATGLHASVVLGSSGYGYNTAEALASYTDTFKNKLNMAVSFQLKFAVDATLVNTGGGAYDYLNVQYFKGLPSTPFGPANSYNVYPSPDGALQTWEYSGTDGVNLQTITDPVTIAPLGTYAFSFTLDADAQTLLEPGQTNFGGAPEGIVNALNTLTFTGFSAEDAFGNPLPASDFISADGTNYAPTGGVPEGVPEPATFGMCGACLLLLGISKRRRRVKTSGAF